MRVQILAIAALSSAILVGMGCGSSSKSTDSDVSTGGMASAATGGGVSTGGSSSADGALQTPATVTMAAGTSGTTVGASICQSFIGGGVGFSLAARSTSDCPPGGQVYLSFLLNTGSGDYSVMAGDKMASDGGIAGPVTFTSTTHGMVSQAGSSDTRDDVSMLSAGDSVTIETGDGSITFKFSGNDVAVSSFMVN